jgi:ASC-1-like (ASCH) protein
MRLVFNKTNKAIFEALKSGEKKIETRASTVKYKNLKMGDTISFSCDGEVFEREIKKTTHFASIEALLKAYTPQDINPKSITKEEITAMFYSFPGYKEKIEKEGIVALEFT